MKIFAERLKELRTENNLSQAKLAKILKISNGTIGFWETDKAEPTAPNLILLANFFKVTVDFLIGLENEYGDKMQTDYNYHFEYEGNGTRLIHKEKKK